MTVFSEEAIRSWPPESRVSSAIKFLRRPGGKVLSGSMIMLAGSAFVTLLMLASCINLAFQLVSAKLIARAATMEQKAAIYQALMKRAWYVGAGLTAFLFIVRQPLADYLRLPQTRLVDVLAAGMLFYIPLGVRRGAMQGLCRFVRLSANLTAEAVVKLIGAIAFIVMGAGVFGAVGAISLSVFAAYMLPADDAELRVK
jgi:hypothetical protein